MQALARAARRGARVRHMLGPVCVRALAGDVALHRKALHGSQAPPSSGLTAAHLYLAQVGYGTRMSHTHARSHAPLAPACVHIAGRAAPRHASTGPGAGRASTETMARRPFLISLTFSSANTSGSSARPSGSKGPPARRARVSALPHGHAARARRKRPCSAFHMRPQQHLTSHTRSPEALFE